MKDCHQATALVSIDLSAAFDLVAHDVLVKRLDNYFGFRATVLDWFKSFLADRSQCVILGNARPKSISVLQGVPQGSVLGARLYTLYVRPMSEIIMSEIIFSRNKTPVHNAIRAGNNGAAAQDTSRYSVLH